MIASAVPATTKWRSLVSNVSKSGFTTNWPLTRPIFTPAVGRYAQGMLVELPLHLGLLEGSCSLGDIHGARSEEHTSELQSH